MKKFLATALTVFFVTATSGLVLADAPATTSPAASTAPVKKAHKGRHHKKAKRTPAPVASSTPTK